MRQTPTYSLCTDVWTCQARGSILALVAVSIGLACNRPPPGPSETSEPPSSSAVLREAAPTSSAYVGAHHLEIKTSLDLVYVAEALSRDCEMARAGLAAMPDWQRIDQWGRPLRLDCLSTAYWVLRSAGPDGVFGTPDDVMIDNSVADSAIP